MYTPPGARGATAQRFVGGTPRSKLRQAFDKAGEGHGQVVAVVGEAGVGKSRLFYEFTRSHRARSWLVIEAGSVSYGKATPYLPVIDLLQAYFQIETRDDHRRIREKVTGKLLTLDRSLEAAVPAVLALLDVPVEDPQWEALDPPRRRQRTLDAVKRLLVRESQVQPLLWCSRISTGSMRSPRRCSTAWSRFWPVPGCCCSSTIARSTSARVGRSGHSPARRPLPPSASASSTELRATTTTPTSPSPPGHDVRRDGYAGLWPEQAEAEMRALR